jgi:hypothetical protein
VVAEAVGPARVFEQARDSAEFWVAAPSGAVVPVGGQRAESADHNCAVEEIWKC